MKKLSNYVLIAYLIIFYLVMLINAINQLKLGIDYSDLFKGKYISLVISGESNVKILNTDSGFRIESENSQNIKIKKNSIVINSADVKIYTSGKSTVVAAIKENSNVQIETESNIKKLILVITNSNLALTADSLSSLSISLKQSTASVDASKIDLLDVNLDEAFLNVNVRNSLTKLTGKADNKSKIILSKQPKELDVKAKNIEIRK